MAMVSETRQVPAFDGIELKGTGVLRVTQGPEPALTIDADAETIDKIVTDVEGNTLVIRFKWLDALLALRPLGPIDLRITTPDLRVVKINGAGTLIGETPLSTDRLFLSVTGSGKVALELQAEELRANVSGSGDFKLRGKVKRQEISISGSGDYDAAELESADADITIAGSGRARLSASERLDVTISGSGKVDYAGNPAVSQRISGSGTVVQRPTFATEPRPSPGAETGAPDAEDVETADPAETRDPDA